MSFLSARLPPYEQGLLALVWCTDLHATRIPLGRCGAIVSVRVAERKTAGAADVSRARSASKHAGDLRVFSGQTWMVVAASDCSIVRQDQCGVKGVKPRQHMKQPHGPTVCRRRGGIFSALYWRKNKIKLEVFEATSSNTNQRLSLRFSLPSHTLNPNQPLSRPGFLTSELIVGPVLSPE